MTAPQRETAGFTLVEVLVALVLVGILTTAVFGGLRFAAHAWASASHRSSVVGDAAAIQNLLRNAISQAYPAYAYSGFSDYRVAFSGRSDSLVFTGPLPEAIEEGVMASQRIYAAPKDSGLAMVLGWRLDLPSSDLGTSMIEQQVQLLDHVRSLHFTYYGALGPREPARWWDTWLDQARLPELVRIQVQLEDDHSPGWPDVVIEPRTNINVACVYDPSSLSCRRIR